VAISNKAVDSVCREFDLLGGLDRTRVVPRRLVDEMYSVPLVLIWPLLEPWIEYLRRDDVRGKTHFWELVEFHRRVQFVEGNHPVHTGSRYWTIVRRRRVSKRRKLLREGLTSMRRRYERLAQSGRRGIHSRLAAGSATGAFASARAPTSTPRFSA
jgi:hypothetical protein